MQHMGIGNTGKAIVSTPGNLVINAGPHAHRYRHAYALLPAHYIGTPYCYHMYYRLHKKVGHMSPTIFIYNTILY